MVYLVHVELLVALLTVPMEFLDSTEVEFVLSNARASLDGSGATFPTVFDLPGYVTKDTPQAVGVTAANFLSPAVSGPAVLVDNIILHLEANCYSLILLDLVAVGSGTVLDGQTVPAGTSLDSTLFFIPEPITMTLLGLGGLALIRRRR